MTATARKVLLALAVAGAGLVGCGDRGAAPAGPDATAAPASTTDPIVTLAPTTTVASVPTTSTTTVIPGCRRANLAGRSVAREWNETMLSIIRSEPPAPTVHARNLFHLSAVMWDAWTAYDDPGSGFFLDVEAAAPGDDVAAAREQAMSYAAARLLSSRLDGSASLSDWRETVNFTLDALCYPRELDLSDPDSPAAVGTAIADAAIAFGLADGSRQQERYVTAEHEPVNEPMPVAEPGTVMVDPNRWQPLQMEQAQDQGGFATASIQFFVGAHWGDVATFAEGPVPAPPPPPLLDDPRTDAEFRDGVMSAIRASAALGSDGSETIRIDPGVRGDNSLGADDGDGRPDNPRTGEPYAPNDVDAWEFYRTIAAFWADGPASETPPGHWNVIANRVTGNAAAERRLEGTGPELDALEWDVRLYFALNGALHDAAIAAWNAKAVYETVRPISAIRYLGGLGQSSDPDLPSYDPRGLPLEDGLIELVTAESSAPGERHAHLAASVGELAIRSYNPLFFDPASLDNVGWHLATTWMPFQAPTFVTPAFPGYVSGHSTFSRAAAEVLTEFTGSAYFPEGMLVEFTAETPGGGLSLQSATYYDAADQAGQSRIYGGIHLPFDDYAGRVLGSEVGLAAWATAQDHFAGTASPRLPSPAPS